MDFPRPNPDTGFGFHDSANAYWKPDDYPTYARMLREHGATWFLLWIFDENKAPWAYALRQAGIEVIVRPGPAYMPRPAVDMAVVNSYIDAGCRWFILGNEYNLHQEWSTQDNWQGLDKPIRHVADWFVNISRQITARGAWCLTPPPSLGGHWLHRDWFERFMISLSNIAKEQNITMEELLWHCGIGIHCRSVGNPLEAEPSWYDCSVNEYKWFDEMVNRYVGHSLPMANTEWGDEPGWSKRLNPNFGAREKWAWWVDRNVEQIKWCNPAYHIHYPDHVFANCFWILHSPPPWNDCGLIHNSTYLNEMGGSDMTPLWNALPALVNWNRVDTTPTPPPPPPPPDEDDIPAEVEYAGLSPAMIERLTIDAHSVDKTKPYWKVVKVEIQPDTDHQSAFAVLPVGSDVDVVFGWPDGAFIAEPKSDPYAPEGAREWAASMPMFKSWGAYSVYVQGNSEGLNGFGLYGPNLELDYTAHRPVLVYFKLVQPGSEPEPEPEPEPIPYRFILGLDKRLQEAGLPVVSDIRSVVENDYTDMSVVGKESLNDQGMWSITFHHSGVQTPLDIMALAQYHYTKYGSIAYHFVIDKNGQVYFVKKLDFYSPHCGNSRFNKYSKAICVHGDFTQENPTQAQLSGLRCVVEALEEFVGGGWNQKRGLPIVRHKDIVNTECPGNLYEKYRGG